MTRPLARAGSIAPPRRSFTSAITRPMSFIELAPVSAMIAPIAADASASLICAGRKRSITAMKGGDKETTATLRLAQAAIKNRDIEARTGGAPKDDDTLVTEVLQKMVKQRRESADIYRKNGREDRAQVEEAEIAVLERFLPRQLSDAEAEAKIREIVAETGASSMKDMGRVMALVKERLGGSIEPARASALVKAALG